MTTPANVAKEQGHVRQGSSGRGAPQLPRRSTRGPLDLADAPVTDPLSASAAPQPQASRPNSLVSHHPLSSPLLDVSSHMPVLPTLPIRTLSKSPAPALPAKSFPHLLRPELYHPLPSTSIPPSLLQVTSSSDLRLLLSSSQFRNAAIVAARKLTTEVSSTDVTSIFELLYVRLACLTLVGQTQVAAQEVKVLGDLNEAVYVDEEGKNAVNIVPWELRVLAVRLQGIGYGDPRKGVMGYYDLAREARLELTRLEGGDSDAARLWEERLKDLGIRVASALVEMGDLAGAAAHLRTLRSETAGREAAFREALLWLKIGDVDRARAVIASDGEAKKEEQFVITALAKMAEGNYREAADVWRGMLDRVNMERKWEGEEMWRVNLGVCLLYSGQIGEARDLMESTISTGTAFHALTFNLSTIYELSTDRSRVLKTQLVGKVAALQDTPSFTNADFKL